MTDLWQEEPQDVITVKLEELATEEQKLHPNPNRYMVICKRFFNKNFIFVLVSYNR
jgi:hypothetical protein